MHGQHKRRDHARPASGLPARADAEDVYSWKAVSAGSDHTCAVRSDDRLACWGADDYGQVSGKPGALGAVKHVSVNGLDTCVIDPDDHLVCWGFNGDGQTSLALLLHDHPVAGFDAGPYGSCAIRAVDHGVVCLGDNTYGEASPPSSLRPVKAISAGGTHSCATKPDDTLVCWAIPGSGAALRRGRCGAWSPATATPARSRPPTN